MKVIAKLKLDLEDIHIGAKTTIFLIIEFFMFFSL